MHAPVRTPAASCLAALALALLAAPAGAAEPAAVPRYRLQVGQELVYSGSSTFKYKGGQLNDRSTWRVWVTRANPDGSWHLVLRNGTAFSQGDADAAPREERVTFAYCDLFPDGRLVENDSLGFNLSPQAVLPRLPRDAAEAAKGWAATSERTDETTHYRLLEKPAETDRVSFEAVQESPLDVIYGLENKGIVTFDTRRGLAEKVESDNKQTYGFDGKGHGTTKLDEVREHDSAWARDFTADADRFFAAQEAYQAALRDRRATVKQIKAALAKAADGLRAARKELKQPEFRKQVDELLTRHEESAKYYVEEAEKRAEVLDKPAPAWDTTDLEDRKHALKDYRGKVVILDFWYRGCGWCMRAMPQVKEVADHFRGQPVVVLGMNTDKEEKDAQFVVDKLGLKYPVLKASDLPEKYKVDGFPTLIIIDQEGVVRDVHEGYSPTLRDEVVKSVEDLLKPKP